MSKFRVAPFATYILLYFPSHDDFADIAVTSTIDFSVLLLPSLVQLAIFAFTLKRDTYSAETVYNLSWHGCEQHNLHWVSSLVSTLDCRPLIITAVIFDLHRSVKFISDLSVPLPRNFSIEMMTLSSFTRYLHSRYLHLRLHL